MLRQFLLSACAIAFIATPAAAWNDRGHMIIAAKAWRHLTPETKTAVKALLKHNPRYSSWVAGLPSASRSRAAFIRAATWPDYIKSAPGYVKTSISNAKSTRNIGYDDCLQHRYWHYKDLPFSSDGTPTFQAPEPNAETQIRTFMAVLADPTVSNDIKSYDLAWLLHLVGDVHQPLHATQRFIATATDGDGGGNDVKVCLTTQCNGGSALHSFWDGAFGDNETLSSVISFASQMFTPSEQNSSNLDPTAWFQESFEIAKAKVYVAPIGNELGPYLLTNAYRNEAAIVATERAALAAMRLANILNGANIQVSAQAPVSHHCPNGI
jgi:hypothetical protein